ncbi:hypothetical protein HPP92_019065 [Vanilla planifolia]|uniref:Uncharacterized protein n=1 Tax=Vanilla planifolia TaxID=51239 RepID=A0A835Q284_VANPL|nr:hypothetical protein HPP92_019065 [Vanilla planifolia]
MKGTIAKMQEHEVLVSQKEEEAAVAGFKRFQLVSIAARAERLAALKLGDSEEGELLLKEAEAAEERARELGQIYNLNMDDFETMSEHVVSVAFITTCSGEQLAEIAAFKPSIADT